MAMNGSRRRLSAVLVAALGGFANSAHACGELMLRSLGAMRFHAFVTRNPSTILLYSGKPPAADNRPSATDAKMHDGLERVGHKVNLARGPGELDQALTSGHYDVMVAYADDMLGAAGLIAKAQKAPALIPVMDSDAPNEHEMRERYPRLVTGTFNDLLKAIERATTATKAA
jgi:hypothetical protein